jgi:hypothetical protein
LKIQDKGSVGGNLTNNTKGKTASGHLEIAVPINFVAIYGHRKSQTRILLRRFPSDIQIPAAVEN